jgi:LmbE family N-acetylglucosaminyl deacetylase
MVHRGLVAALAVVLQTTVPGPAPAQSLGPSTGGLVALDQALRFLGHNERVLMIAAHPDDEDTELLTLLGRGMGAEAAYLSLTRGEGGQNLIGNELGPALGILRTEELLAARTLDGARQYFTRAYDFGFSKNLPDTWRFWPRDSVLKDVVRIVRRFRPQVIVAIFSGTPRDGHGQHQASGWAAREAFQAAGDSARFPELSQDEGLTPWRPLKLYQSARFGAEEPTLVLEGGVIDRAVGQSYLQIAMRGRSLHRSQDMGAPQRMGPSPIRLRLIDDRTGAGAGGIFAGIDTSLAGGAGPVGEARRAAFDSVAMALRNLSPLDAHQLAPLRRRLESLLGAPATWTPAMRDQMGRIDAAAFAASGALCDALADAEHVVQGGRLTVILSCWNTTEEAIELTGRLKIAGMEDRVGPTRQLGRAQVMADTLRLALPADMPITQPYFLRTPLQGAIYSWPTDSRELWGQPFEPPPFVAEFVSEGRSIRREVQYRFVDQALGEVRRPVFVVPRIELTVEPTSGLWRRNATSPREFQVRIRHLATDTTTGTVALEGPAGWTVTSAQRFRLKGEHEEVVKPFTITLTGGQGSALFHAVARDDAGPRYSNGITWIDYPHIHPRHLVHPAESRLVVADIRLPPAGRIGYVRGAADRIPESLSTLGLDLVLLTRDSLSGGDLSQYRTIVIGPRAYEIEPALHEFNHRLLEYVKEGGSVVVQYQQQVYFRGGYAPYPLSLTERIGDQPARVVAPRVAEEYAAVVVLDSAHPIVSRPNRLVPDDWAGWVQERGLYFARSWNSEWTPLLEMADAGEPPQRGGLLLSHYGKGTYVYTGLSFFRELPAAVPGAARLFMNLLALR